MPSRTLLLLTLLAALLVPCTGCKILREFKLGGDDPQWLEKDYDGLSRSDAVYVVAAEVARQFNLARRDDVAGEVESHWFLGDIERRTARQMRVRVLAEVERRDEGGVRVRLRVQREVADSPGMLRDPEDGDWEPFDDDVVTARTLMQKIQIVLQDFVAEGEAANP